MDVDNLLYLSSQDSHRDPEGHLEDLVDGDPRQCTWCGSEGVLPRSDLYCCAEPTCSLHAKICSTCGKFVCEQCAVFCDSAEDRLSECDAVACTDCSRGFAFEPHTLRTLCIPCQNHTTTTTTTSSDRRRRCRLPTT
jgi:hypothetical protein